jgi:hypothetical protein
MNKEYKVGSCSPCCFSEYNGKYRFTYSGNNMQNAAIFVNILKDKCPNVPIFGMFISRSPYVAGGFIKERQGLSASEIRDIGYQILNPDQLTAPFDKFYFVYTNYKQEKNFTDTSDSSDDMMEDISTTGVDYLKHTQKVKKAKNIIFKNLVDMFA